jgi:hypothetical protein
VNARLAILATILTAATGCDKAKTWVSAGREAQPPTVSPAEELDLGSRPDLLFQVFGTADDPRMIPIAVLRDGTLQRITLSPAGWRRLDAMYLRPGRSYPVYENGRPIGTAEVRRGMWEQPDHPLYTLAGCQTLTPMAAVQVVRDRPTEAFTVEYLASTAKLGRPPAGSGLSILATEQIARRVAATVAADVRITPRLLDSLDFHAVSFASGATAKPTIVASFIDPAAEAPASTGAHTTHLLLIADGDSTGTYHATFVHRINGPVASAAFRRYLDHLDLTGDGVDEIVLEGWRYGMDTFLLVLRWDGARWTEMYRTRPTWCLDERAAGP